MGGMWVGWDGMGWDGMGWDGMGWDGMGVGGMGSRATWRESSQSYGIHQGQLPLCVLGYPPIHCLISPLLAL